MLWLFRDMNNVRQIENSRKDVNLKEFQKIAEWASGQHLPEIKKTKKSAADNREESTIEMTHPPEGEIAISRWQGATALQISAIEQLGSYLRGNHGTELQKPAFLLLKQLWANLVTSALKEMSLEHPPLFAGNTALAQKTQSPLGQTLNRVLLQHHEIWCERFPEELLGIVLTGFDNTLIPLPFTLKNKSLQRVNFIGATLSRAHLTGANLSRTDLSGANLNGADLRHCYFDAHTTWQAAEDMDMVMLCSSENRTDFPVPREYLRAQATGQLVEISTETVNYLYQHQPNYRISSTEEEIKQSFDEIRKNHT